MSKISDAKWTSLQVGRGLAEICKQSQEEHPGFPVFLVALGDFQGGGLWVESVSNKGSVLRRLSEDFWKVGSIWDIQGTWVQVPGGACRVAEPWMGDQVWALKAFVHRSARDLNEVEIAELRDLGFESPEGPGEVPVRKVGTCGPLGSKDDSASWEIDFPHEIWSAESQPGWLQHQVSSSHRCRKLASELVAAPCDLVGVVSRELWAAQAESCWCEEVLGRNRHPEEHLISLRSLRVEVPLNENSGTPADQFLQTRTISLEEARAELPLWMEAAREEVQALESVTEAVERITAKDVEELLQEGRKVVQIPGKAVLTRKSGVGKRRFRAVCCSNHAPASEFNLSRADLYAGGVDSLTVRIVLSYVSQFDGWTGCSIDIKTAFLNAPVNGGAAVDDQSTPLIVVKPPHLLVQMGLMAHHHRWLVRKALYGLQTSPRDWSTYRDQLLRKIRLEQPVVAVLVQSVTDENLWLLKERDGTLRALVIVYVDDMALFGQRQHVEALVQEIQGLWKISTPTWPSDDAPIVFCGMELWRFVGGWKITQRRYLQELLQRFQVKGSCSAPMTRWEEPSEEHPKPEEVKDAQAITGVLLWAVTRTRPDLSFTVSRMAQYATKTPRQVREWGMQALRYVSTVMGLGLEFRKDPGPLFGHQSQLALPRDGGSLEVYSDASHSPGGDRSLQCIIASWRGCLLVWEATRQSFVTLSSAESELVAMTAALQVSESVSPVLEELTQSDLRCSLLGDNVAAITSFHQSSGSWRNRHLRMRARAGRERIEAGSLTVSHVAGTLQVADIGTKPLPVGRLLDLLVIVNVRVSEEERTGPLAAKFFGRACAVSAQTAEKCRDISPALAVALAMLISLPPGEAALCKPSFSTGSMLSILAVGAEAQPREESRYILRSWEVCSAFLVVVALLLVVWWGRSRPRVSGLSLSLECPEGSEDSPRFRSSRAGSSMDLPTSSFPAPPSPPQQESMRR